MDKFEGTTAAAKVVKNTFFNIGGRFFCMVVLFVLTPYIVNKLGLERYGLWAIVSAITGYFGLLDFGLKNSFRKYIAEFFAKDEVDNVNGTINSGFIFYVILGLILVGASFFFIKPLIGLFQISVELYNEASMVIFLGIVLFSVVNILSPFEAIQFSLQRMDILNVMVVLYYVLLAFGTVFFLERGYGLIGLMVNYIAVTLIIGGLNFFIAFKVFPKFQFNPFNINYAVFKKLLNFGYKMQLTAVANVVAHQTDKIFISHFLAVGLVSFYHLGCGFVYYVMMVPNLLASALLPAFSTVEALGERARLVSIHIRSSRYTAFFIIPFFIFIFMSTGHLMRFWMGQGYEMSSYIVRVLIIGWFFNALAAVSVSTSMAIDKPQFMSISAIFMVCVNIILSYVLIRIFGFYGAAWGTMLAIGSGSILFVFLLYRELKIKFVNFVRLIIPFSVMCIIPCVFFLTIELINRYLSFPSNRIIEFSILLIQGIVFFATYTIFVFASKLINDQDLEFMSLNTPVLYKMLKRIFIFLRIRLAKEDLSEAGRKKVIMSVMTFEGEKAACCKIRIDSPFAHFDQNHFNLIKIPSLKAVMTSPFKPDIIFIRRNYHPFSYSSKLIDFASKKGIITVMDIDDYILDIPFGHPSRDYYHSVRDNMIEFMKRVDFITVSTDELRNRFSEINKNVMLLPNYIDSRIWLKGNIERAKSSDGRISIGYAGSTTHKYDFKSITPAIKHVLSKYKGKVCFNFIRCVPQELLGLDGVNYYPGRTMDYLPFADFLRGVDFDFALAPLEDNTFNRCKSNIKYLEYSICNIPAVYSKVGPYIDSIRDGDNGILVNNTKESWIKGMELLIENDNLRHSIAEKANRDVRANYMLEKNVFVWVDFFESIRNKALASGLKGFSPEYFMISIPHLIRSQISKTYWDVRHSIGK